MRIIYWQDVIGRWCWTTVRDEGPSYRLMCNECEWMISAMGWPQ